MTEVNTAETTIRIGAILAAAGAGSRFSSQTATNAKQFLNLMGRPMYVWSLVKLATHPAIDSVVVVAPEASISLVRKDFENFHSELSRCRQLAVTAGGSTRQQSVYNGLRYLATLVNAPEFVLIHDGARPFIGEQLITQVIESVIANGACTPGLPVTDTLKRVREHIIIETVDRAELYSVQTPQAGRLSDLCHAHEKALVENWSVTDDASMLERDGHMVAIVPGSPYNLKVTQPLDLVLCEALAPRLLTS